MEAVIGGIERGGITGIKPLDIATDNCKILMDNDQVRVLEYQSLPKEKWPIRQHPASVLYSLGWMTLKITKKSGTSQSYELEPGELLWLEESSHLAENVGSAGALFLVIELKCNRWMKDKVKTKSVKKVTKRQLLQLV